MGNTSEHEQQARNALQRQQVDFKVNIAVDFGTIGCGLAFAYDNEVFVYNKWKVKKRQRTLKINTQILLNEDDEMVAFGDKAMQIYSNLSGKEKQTWKLFDRFKMSLYGKHCDQLKTTNDLTCDASIIFIQTFKYLRTIALEYVTKITQQTFQSDEIQWILTVPAIWDERAKSNMKTWIIAAGLVNEAIINQCLIVYEPDCAALAIREEIKPNDDHKQDTAPEAMELKIGDKYILIDAGGGTVDIVCHEVIDDDSVQEIHYPSGGLWGGDFLNQQYIHLLNEIFGEDIMTTFRKTCGNVYLDLIHSFRDAKVSFLKTKPLPYILFNYHLNSCNIYMNNVTQRSMKWFTNSTNKKQFPHTMMTKSTKRS
eukprot:620685_1